VNDHISADCIQLSVSMTMAYGRLCNTPIADLGSTLSRLRVCAVSTMFYEQCYSYGSESRGFIMYTFIYKYIQSHGHEDAFSNSVRNSV